MIIEFVGFFSIEFLFTFDYPYAPPVLSFFSGDLNQNIFQIDGSVKLEIVQKTKWTPVKGLIDIIKEIEQLIVNCPKPFLLKQIKYTKRRWDDYIDDQKSFEINQNELDKTIKLRNK